MSGVMPLPPAEFSPLAMMTSSPCRARNFGRRILTALRPGLPTMSPMKSIFTRKNLTAKDAKDTKENGGGSAGILGCGFTETSGSVFWRVEKTRTSRLEKLLYTKHHSQEAIAPISSEGKQKIK